MRNFLFLLYFVFFSIGALAQHQTNADSLKQVIASMKDDSLKAKNDAEVKNVVNWVLTR